MKIKFDKKFSTQTKEKADEKPMRSVKRERSSSAVRKKKTPKIDSNSNLLHETASSIKKKESVFDQSKNVYNEDYKFLTKITKFTNINSEKSHSK